MGKKYIDFVIEIEKLKLKHSLSSIQILLLQVAAAFEVDELNYEKLKKEFLKP